jgi:hypothetical protein
MLLQLPCAVLALVESVAEEEADAVESVVDVGVPVALELLEVALSLELPVEEEPESTLALLP